MLSILLGGLTSLGTALVTAYNKSKDVTIASYGMISSVAASQAQAMTAWVGHPFSPPAILAYAVSLYYGKAILYDNVISYWITGHDGFTPALGGNTGIVASVVISGMFLNGMVRR